MKPPPELPRDLRHYVLDSEGQPQVCTDLLLWAAWLETADRHVLFTRVSEDVTVSTVFLGLDYGFGFGGPPLLFETMIFGGEHDGYQRRHTTREEALEGHQRALDVVAGKESAHDEE